MATGLQYKNDPKIEGDTHGYSAGVSSGAVNNWTDIALSGSHTSVIYWDDGHTLRGTSCYGNESRVYMTITDSWTATVNDVTNAITIHVTSSYSMNRQALSWGGNSCSTAVCWRDLHIFDTRGGTELKSVSDCLVSTGVFDTGSRSFDITLQHGQETSTGTWFIRNDARGYETVYYDLISCGMRFKNTLPAAKYSPVASISCGVVADTTNGRVTASVSDWGCPAGGSPANVCNNTMLVQWSTDSAFSQIIATGTGTKGLTPNTRYYVRVIASNGKYTTTQTCNFVTLASSYPYGYSFVSDQVSRLKVQINNGSDECNIETKLYVREKGTTTWTLVDTTSAEKGYTKQLRNMIQRGKTYESYTTTTNCSGTYHSSIYEFTPPTTDDIVGEITSADGTLETSGLLADLDYCYKVTSFTVEEVSATNPITSRLEYRPVGQTEWVTTDDVTSTVNPDTICDTVTGLLCGTTYELRTYQRIGNISSYSAVTTVTMPLCAGGNHVCENLNYMTELICQQLVGIKMGVKTIYTNCDTKKTCDPYSLTPTLASILSRLLRFAQATACLTCSLGDLHIFGSGQTNQVFMASSVGSTGNWVDLEEDAIEDSENIISSNGVKVAIDRYLHSVMRPIGTYNYYAEDMTDLVAQSSSATSGDTAVIGDKYYTYGNSTWTETGDVPDLQDFGLIAIKDGTWAGKEFYYWNDKWNLLDIDVDALTARIEALEEATPVVSYETTDYRYIVVSNGLTDAQIAAAITPSSKPTIIFVAQMVTTAYFTLDNSALDDQGRILA